jgi:hypothetical protein
LPVDGHSGRLCWESPRRGARAPGSSMHTRASPGARISGYHRPGKKASPKKGGKGGMGAVHADALRVSSISRGQSETCGDCTHPPNEPGYGYAVGAGFMK